MAVGPPRAPAPPGCPRVGTTPGCLAGRTRNCCPHSSHSRSLPPFLAWPFPGKCRVRICPCVSMALCVSLCPSWGGHSPIPCSGCCPGCLSLPSQAWSLGSVSQRAGLWEQGQDLLLDPSWDPGPCGDAPCPTHHPVCPCTLLLALNAGSRGLCPTGNDPGAFLGRVGQGGTRWPGAVGTALGTSPACHSRGVGGSVPGPVPESPPALSGTQVHP